MNAHRRALLATLLTLVSLPSVGQTLFNVTETTEANGVVNLVGDGLASAQAYVRRGNPDGTFGQAQPCAKLTGNDGDIQVRVPSTVDRGPWQIWVKQDGATTTSNALELNAPRVTFQSRDRCYPGEEITLYGRNLGSFIGTPEIRFVAPDGTTLMAGPASANPNGWRLIFRAPTTMAMGVSYRVEVCGMGVDNPTGHTFCPSTMTTTLRRDDMFGLDTGLTNGIASFQNNYYNVKTDPRLILKAVGDGVADDTYAIQDALDMAALAGGGVVYLPAGTYKVDRPHRPGGYGASLDVWARTVLRGAGKGATILKTGMRYSPSNPPGIEAFLMLRAEGTNGVADLTIQNLNSSPMPNMVLRKGAVGVVQHDTVLSSVDFQMNNAAPAYLANLDHAIINDCRFSSTNMGEGPISVCGSTWLQFTNNDVSYRFGRVDVVQCKDIWIEGSTFARDTNYAVPGSPESGGIQTSLSSRIAIVNCTIAGVGPVATKGIGDGEQIMTQTGVVRDLDYVGRATGGTSTTLTDDAAAWNDATPFVDPRYPGPARLIVALTQGKGAGQWRFIGGANGHTLVVTSPWQVAPDATSVYVVGGMSAYQQTVLWNKISNGMAGVVLFNGGIDNLVAENRLLDTGSILFRTESSPLWRGDASNRTNDLSWFNLAEGNIVTNDTGTTPGAITFTSVVTQGLGFGCSCLGNVARYNLIDVSGTVQFYYAAEACPFDGFFNRSLLYDGLDSQLTNVGSVFVGNRYQGLPKGWYPLGSSACAGFL